jgi:hypothetical protein
LIGFVEFLLYGIGYEPGASSGLGFDLSRRGAGVDKIGGDFMILFDRVHV